MGVARPTLAPGSNLEGLCQQGVAGQNRDAFAEHFVIGQLASAIIIVVHGREVIMDEGIGMDALDGAGQGQRVGFVATTRGGGREAQGGTHALAAGEEGITHRAMDSGGFGGGGGQKAIQGSINGIRPAGQEVWRHVSSH